jgi:hypothetical protein
VTKDQWLAEVTSALAETGWTVFSGDCADDSDFCFAHVDHKSTGRYMQVKLLTSRFPTLESRKAEIIRQVSTHPRGTAEGRL